MLRGQLLDADISPSEIERRYQHALHEIRTARRHTLDAEIYNSKGITSYPLHLTQGKWA